MYARRSIIKGVAGLPLAAVLADPLLAQATAATLQSVSLRTDGGHNVTATLAEPAAAKAPTIMLVHEWWGLNDQIKSVAREFANEGYLALAIDLYGRRVASAPDDARSYMKQVDPTVATDTVASWVNWLRKHERGNGKVATIGWCFGGGWSLNASLAAPVDATVVYYGNVAKKTDQLTSLKGPVLGHFATKDKWINQKMIDGFEAAMKGAGKEYETHWYEADHAFANPTQARYDGADAKLAWQRTLAFLKKHL